MSFKDEQGLVIGYQDVDKFVRINNLPEVTNPTYLDISKYNGRVPTPDGVLSYEIFGVGEERKHRMAYIDLKRHYMNPNAARKLKTYNADCYNILYAKEKYKLIDGELVKDENGRTGGEFLYQIWDKIKFADKSTVTTKAVQDAFSTIPKNLLFVTKCPVIPAALRDINSANEMKLSTAEINDIYSKLIMYSRDVTTDGNSLFGFMGDLTAARIQTLLDELYQKLMIDKIKGNPAKYGFNKRYVVAKNVGYTSRAVVTAPNLNVESVDSMLVKFGEAGVPLAQVTSLFFPFISKWIVDFFANEFGSSSRYPYVTADGKEDFIEVENRYNAPYVHDMLSRFVKSPNARIEPIMVPTKDRSKKIFMKHKGRFHKENTSINRPMYWLDVVYIAAVDVCSNKHLDITRYPVTSENSQYPSKIAVLSTRTTSPVIIGDTVYPHYPVIEFNVDPTNLFLDSMQMSNTFAPQLGMDYDGDQTSQKSRFTNEANKEADDLITSKSYYLSINGKWMRELSREFVLTSYMLTKGATGEDLNASPPAYKL